MLAKAFTITITLAATCNAAIVQLYSDNQCNNWVGERNVWDNTCATMGEMGFSSYKITTSGGGNQVLSSYVMDACLCAVSSCKEAWKVGECVNAIIEEGSSHAMSSYTFCAHNECF